MILGAIPTVSNNFCCLPPLTGKMPSSPQRNDQMIFSLVETYWNITWVRSRGHTSYEGQVGVAQALHFPFDFDTWDVSFELSSVFFFFAF